MVVYYPWFMQLPQKLVRIAYTEEIISYLFSSMLAWFYKNGAAEISEMLQLLYFFFWSDLDFKLKILFVISIELFYGSHFSQMTTSRS